MEEKATLGGTSHEGCEIRKFWLMGGALVLSVLLAVLLAARPADAEPRIKVSGCNVYVTNTVDPIVAFSQHLHHHFGNTTTTNTSTGQSLLAANQTSCKALWFTSAGWFPKARDVPLVSKNQVAVYYRAPGDRTKVQNIPTGLKIISEEAHLNSGGSTVTVTFPDCVAMNSSRTAPLLDSPDHHSHMVKSRNGICPSTHPYRIPRVFYLIRYNGTVTSQTMFSAGVNTWEEFGTHMHADYLAANQQPVFNDLIDLCLRRAVASPACG
jgi:Domain of unknown function (DUF1996)